MIHQQQSKHDDQVASLSDQQQYVTVYVPVEIPNNDIWMSSQSRGVWRDGVFLSIGLELDVESLALELEQLSVPAIQSSRAIGSVPSSSSLPTITDLQDYSYPPIESNYEDSMDIVDDKEDSPTTETSTNDSSDTSESPVTRRKREKRWKSYEPQGKRTKEKLSTVVCNGVKSNFYRCYW
jgi:hypothetical protein